MTFNKNVVLAFAVGIGAGVAAGCQTYDFEPVEPLAIAQTTQARKVIAKQAKPNLMLLVDKSGSMDFPAYQGGPSRMQELKTAMNTFLGSFNQKPVARVGLLIYPQEGPDSDGVVGCAPARLEDINTQGRGVPLPNADDDQSLKDAAATVNQVIQGLRASGGTPTAASLRVLANYQPLTTDTRQNFVLLLTDGLPNCNSAQPLNNCGGNTACNITCTDSSWREGMGCCTQPQASQCSSSFCAKGCLDAAGPNGAIQAIKDLRAKGIKTIVVGFGADLVAGPGPVTLNQMAEAGGFARTCPNGTNAECGAGNTCITSTKVCEKKYYAAGNAQELSTALAQIGDIVGIGDPCVYQLEATPSDPRFLSVLIDGVATPSGDSTWKYEAGKVVFQGALCDRLKNATPASPVNVEFRIVEGL